MRKPFPVAQKDNLSAIAWNRKVQRILAAGSSDGVVVCCLFVLLLLLLFFIHFFFFLERLGFKGSKACEGSPN